jgi:hypothetical membrane protein
MDRVREHRLQRLTSLAGIVGVLVAGVAIATSIHLSPWFTWTTNALSHLGRPGRTSAPVFNGGLIVAGLFGLVFALGQWHRRSGRVAALGSATLAASFVCLSLIGVFPVGHPAHVPVSVAFFAGFTYGLFLTGSGDILAGTVGPGLGAIWVGIVHVTVWVGWIVVGTDGVAIPETVGAVLLAAWVLHTAREGAQVQAVRG